MAIDTQSLLLDPIYDTLGVDAMLDAGSTGEIDGLTVLDKTQGVMLESQNGGMQFGTSKPAACIRVSEMTANNLTRDNILNRIITFGGNDWKVFKTQPKPTPNSAGEVYLILQDV